MDGRVPHAVLGQGRGQKDALGQGLALGSPNFAERLAQRHHVQRAGRPIHLKIFRCLEGG